MRARHGDPACALTPDPVIWVPGAARQTLSIELSLSQTITTAMSMAHPLEDDTRHRLARAIGRCMGVDRPRLRRRLRDIGASPARLRALEAAIEAAQARVARRRATLPRPRYPDALPVVASRAEIAQAIRDHQVVIVCGETGSGKTTQLPKICLDLGRGVYGMIGHTQPRRLAARSVASRIASELGCQLGQEVGFKVRFRDQVGEQTHIKLMTDGIALAEIQHDRLLRQYDTLIVDEAHERSLNIDFLLGYLKRILPRRPELKLIITSATIDPGAFSRHFDGAPVIEVSGRGHPVELRYRPLGDEQGDGRLDEGIVEAVGELSREGPGDILVFLPGERDIREAAEALRRHHHGLEILPLYARLSAAEQDRVFQPHGRRRVVLATNVAETSLTVPGIRYVVDSGLARISRYSPRSKVQQLRIEPVSQASARQRAGRCGRLGPGICIRLYAQDDHEQRAPFTAPEIRRTNLAAVILQMHHLGLGAVDAFPFMDPPESRYIKDGLRVLEELGAVDGARSLTPVGRQLAQLPVDPRLGRMLIAADGARCLTEMLVVVSALESQDPRERPLDRQAAADEQHRAFADPRSDFVSILNLWGFVQGQQRERSNSRFRKLCKTRFLSYLRVREWQDIHRQLQAQTREMGLKENDQAAEYTPLHQAILTGLLSHVGLRAEDNEYVGTRNRRFRVFPGSGLSASPPKWLMATALTETGRLYARTNARIEPRWIEQAAPHLVRREYSEPHWQPRPAQVGAFEKVTLYGLVLASRRRVNYGPIDPVASREIFIREALVAGRHRSRGRFLVHNRQLIEEIRALEARSRRRDILIDEQTLYDFYAQRIPAGIHSGKAFEQWLRKDGHDRQLFMDRKALMHHPAAAVTGDRFPDHLPVAGARLPLEYHFEPGDPRDGITVTLPLALLNQIQGHELEWLVLGMLHEKAVALIKALPKSLRRNFVPAPDFATACLEALTPGSGPLHEALSRELRRMTGVAVPAGTWAEEGLPDHLRMRIRVVDGQGKTLQTGRELEALRSTLSGLAAEAFQATPGPEAAGPPVCAWDFGSLDEPRELDHGGLRLQAYPALVAEGPALRLRLLETPEAAREASRLGITRLYQTVLREQTRHVGKTLPRFQSLALLYRPLGNPEALRQELLDTVFDKAFLTPHGPPVDRDGFEQRLEAGRSRLIPLAEALAAQTHEILSAHRALRRRLETRLPLTWIEAARDIGAQLDGLIYPEFIRRTPAQWFERLPVYLEAVHLRLEKLEQDPGRDRRLRQEIAPWWQRCRARLEAGCTDPGFEQFRWMVEELRISLFAQTLGTALPVSPQRLERQWRSCSGA